MFQVYSKASSTFNAPFWITKDPHVLFERELDDGFRMEAERRTLQTMPTVTGIEFEVARWSAW